MLGNTSSITVVGGGIVGLAVALRLNERYPDAQISVLEKEQEVGQHQSGNNSGVLHAGLYYKPGSAKARLAVRGIRQMTEFCKSHEIPHEICGKIVVATQASELPRLHSLFQRGQSNGLQGLSLLGPEQIRGREPHVKGLAAIHVPEEGIVDYRAVCRAMSSLLPGKVHTNACVRQIRRSGKKWLCETDAGEFRSDYLINCAGLHCDRVAEKAGLRRVHRIVPFRGEYYKLKPESSHLVRHLVYPVPDPAFPFLGVHFTRLIRGGIEAGPNAVLAFAREGYTRWKIDPADLVDSLSYGGLWRFAGRHSRMCIHEMRQSFSRTAFCRSLQRLVPEISVSDLQTGGAGVRAQALDVNGRLVEDFVFQRAPGAVHLLNAPSPAATASLAIGEEVVNELESCAREVD